MSQCCSEITCKRKKPYAVFLGLLSGRVYLASNYRDVLPGVRKVVGPKHDITPAIADFILFNRDWVREVLGDGKEDEGE